MKTKNTGFALLEVLISVLIMSFGVLALAKFQGNLHVGQDTASNRTYAQGLGMQVVNDQAGQFAVATAPAVAASGADSVAGKTAAYSRSWALAPDALGNAVIEARVSWTNSRGQSDYVKVATLVASNATMEEAKMVASPPPPMSGTPAAVPVSKTPPWLVSDSGPSTPPTTTTPTPPTTTVPPVVDTPPVTYTITGVITIKNNGAWSNGLTWSVAAAGVTCTSDSATRPTSFSCTVPSGYTGALKVTVSTGGTATPATTSYANVNANKTLNIEISKN